MIRCASAMTTANFKQEERYIYPHHGLIRLSLYTHIQNPLYETVQSII